MYHTSGSTGMPKGVTHTHKSLYASAKNRAETLNLTSSDIAFTSSYLAHAAASLVVLLPFLYAGGTSVYTNIHTIENYFDLIRKHKLTHFAVSPKDWKEMMETKEFSKDDFKYLKFAFSGGDVVPEKLQKTVLDKTGVPLSIGMGMTECGGYITTPPGMKFKFGSLGKPVKGVEIRLVDDEFKDVPAGETGEIVVKSDMVMAYYYNDEENTKKVFKDGWFLTGDLAFKDEEGYYFFRGRKKNIIVKDTGNINPVEVENSLLEHPGVASVIVMGVDDEESGQKIAACIISKDKNNPPSKKELQEFLKGKIADRKIPDYWLFLDDFPDKTSIKKVNIKQLREMINQKITGNAV
jgi:long-chain acyl-CoA synthetase